MRGALSSLVLFLLFVSSQAALRIVDLSGEWSVTDRRGHNLKGHVPGSIYTDLFAAGIIQDPYYRFNEDQYAWVANRTWIYSTSFQVGDELSSAKVKLELPRVLMYGEIVINGHYIGATNNSFIPFSFGVKSLLKTGQNDIQISLRPHVRYGDQLRKIYNSSFPVSSPWKTLYRLPGFSYGWDFAPSFPGQGIVKPVRLVAYDVAKISYLNVIVTKSSGETWKVQLLAYVNGVSGAKGVLNATLPEFNLSLSQDLTLTNGENVFTFEFSVESPQLWWPLGYGSQPLYNTTIRLSDEGGNFQEEKTKKIGFRTIVLNNDAQGNGNLFIFQVNGVNIMGRGSNYCPSDMFQERITSIVVDRTIQSAAAANMNMLRVWGGGYYPDEDFYEACDRYGILVWLDFMLSDSPYPGDQWFISEMQKEVTHVAKEITSHASLALWSGNNEIEQVINFFFGYDGPIGWDYKKLMIQVIYPILQQHSYNVEYRTSSPSNGFKSMEPLVPWWGPVNTDTRGDYHWYGAPNTDCDDVSTYRHPRFMSEYGWQSIDSFETMKNVTGEEDWNRDSLLMSYPHRQKANNYNANFKSLAETLWGLRDDTGRQDETSFRHWIYLSQLSQAYCVKAQSEHYRRGKGMESNTGGYMFWQLNAPWQGPTWGSLEYGGRWKMLHYFAKKFNAPVTVSSFQNPQRGWDFWLSVEKNEIVSGHFVFEMWSYEGERVKEWKVPGVSWNYMTKYITSYQPDSTVEASKFFLRYGFKGENETEAFGTDFISLTRLKNVPLFDPQITIGSPQQVDATTVRFIIQSERPAFYVFLSSPQDGYWSDNGFLLTPQTPFTVYFYGFKETQAEDVRPSVLSLYDTR
ncbi:beta-mannosidase [Planoprotostelium fungivorum]|uniref:beta-mannosidase n=1 Tax=Planoprotostelium fungivorum TaxID=1890364 RepID=A0A2P6MXC7_9EUKA|nr:beta-mannosidase [Planoprotostelium fungivorum]